MLLEVKKGRQLNFCHDIKIIEIRIYSTGLYILEPLECKEHFNVNMMALYSMKMKIWRFKDV